MKTKISVFITLIALLFGATTTLAQGTKAYFKKNGPIVFQTPVSDIDSIVIYKSVPSGLYLGIIGFNDNLTEKSISQLDTVTKSQFQSFINALPIGYNTALYYAVDNAINMLQAATLPYTLINVSIVTFTDGLDNASTMLNTNYDTQDDYLNAVHTRITGTKIKNLNISAYSIGIKAGDVSDVDAFMANLNAFASNSNNVYQVTSMTDVNSTFGNIATSLYNETQLQSVKIRMPGGYDDGTKIRFTFDNITDATAVANSNCYIEGIYRKGNNSYSLQNIVYQGLKSSSGTTVTGEVSGVNVYFTFENISTASGGNVNINNVEEWRYIASQTPPWQGDSEFGQSGDIEIIVNKKSAVVMLVLDCTSSLNAKDANGFSQMKNAANNFINVLASATGNTGAPLFTDNGVLINGVRWATRNVDAPGIFAASPEDAGMFYQWNRNIGWSAANPMINSNGGSTWDSSTPAGSTWDSANDPSPSGWRVPTYAEIQTLLDANKVNYVWTTQNGVTGEKFTDKATGNNIFLPAAGYRNYNDGALVQVGSYGSYWSSAQYDSSNAYSMDFLSSQIKWNNSSRNYVSSVRSVNTVIDNGVVINGVRWASCNVDKPGTFAAKPEDSGMFYQWNRKIGWSATNPMINSNGGAAWDSSMPAGATWDSANDPSPTGWRVPTYDEIQKLFDTNNVSSIWTILNGINGIKFTDKATGNSIFLPAAGYRPYDGSTLGGVGGRGNYWCSTAYDTDFAYDLFFNSVGPYDWVRDGLNNGFSVRSVAE